MPFSFVPPTLLEGWLPPSRANWELLVWGFQFFPVFTGIQWLTDFYPQGKTSIRSRFNLPGPIAWLLMEIPGLLCAWYCFLTIPPNLPGLTSSTINTLNYRIPKLHPWLDLPSTAPTSPPATTPWNLPIGNKTMLTLYTLHYIYRAILSPLVLNPNMSPIHPIVFVSASWWQLANGLSIGGWLAGYGPTTTWDWAGRAGTIQIGLVVWGWAWLGTMFHDDELREIRREAARRQRRDGVSKAKSAGQGNKSAEGGVTQAQGEDENKTQQAIDTSKVYMLPKNGLYGWILYPHYVCEWVEWGGFWMIGGLHCRPARTFVINEVSTMFPRALAGWRWYVKTFGRERVGGRKAVVPYLL